MEKPLARYYVRTAFKISTELNNLLLVTKKHCDDAEYSRIRAEIANVMAEISLNIINPVLEQHPEIEQEQQQMIEKYGVF